MKPPAHPELPGLRVTVDRVVHETGYPTPPGLPYCFVYFITIHNHSPQGVQVVGRKWVVTNGRGSTMVLEGEGVVGQKPELKSGESFTYNSYHLLETSRGRATGSYLILGEDHKAYVLPIPAFEMEADQDFA